MNARIGSMAKNRAHTNSAAVLALSVVGINPHHLTSKSSKVSYLMKQVVSEKDYKKTVNLR